MKAASHSSSHQYSRRNAKTAHVDEVRHEIYKIDKKNRVHQPVDSPGLTVIRLVNELFADAFDCWDYRFMKKRSRDDGVVRNELNKMFKKTTVQMKARTFSGKDPCPLSPSSRISRHREMPVTFMRAQSYGYSSAA